MLRLGPKMGALGGQHKPDGYLTCVGCQALFGNLDVAAEFASEVALMHVEAHAPAALRAKKRLRLGIQGLCFLRRAGGARALRRRLPFQLCPKHRQPARG